MAKKDAPAPTPPADADAADAGPPVVQQGGLKRKNLIVIAVVTALVWAFAIQTGSTVLMIVVGVLSVALAGVLIWAWRMMAKQRGLVSLLQGSASSPEARRAALAQLDSDKDAGSPVKVFARAQLLAQDNPKGALDLLSKTELKAFPPAMQDDVSLMKTQLYLGFGRTADARKSADSINLDNPARKEIHALAASIVAEAWARTGKAKEALALVETIEIPKQNAEQIAVQIRIARIFAKFAANQRAAARNDLVSLAEDDLNHLSRFVAPQFRVHPELQKLARQVVERHPAARKMIRAQGVRR